jgi:uncharacterized protein
MSPAMATHGSRGVGRGAAVGALTIVIVALASLSVPREQHGSEPGIAAIALDPLPGATAPSSALRERLGRAAARVDASTPLRTRHRMPDGQARYTNRLILERSPYLLQHAHNPVDWYPWGDEAFARALHEHRPVLLSIGYSTCHWCHVMEEESFEDEEIAAYMNANYVAIKVDREQRPDLDTVYMQALLTLSGNGGWPMTLWLTPERQPFFATTYVPARDGERGTRVGFLTLLHELRGAFDEHPLRVAEQAQAVTDRVHALESPPPGDALPGAEVLRQAYAEYAATFDDVHGGFGGAPKFPSPGALQFLLRYHRRTGDEHALTMVTRTLDAMAAGGIHDQVGGGFHRYATDAAWQVPHFEKMLSDNAQLATAYLEAYQVTHRREFADTARAVLDDVAHNLTAPEGVFYTATDADSAAGEGAFFVWTPAEIREVLNPGMATAVLTFYGVGEHGNFGDATILHAPRPLADVARDLGTDTERLRFILSDALRLLSERRATRPLPLTDTKIVTAWNGLMISAFARAGAVLEAPAYLDRARKAARVMLAGRGDDGRLPRSHTLGAAEGTGFLDDYADLAAGLVDLYDATSEPEWLQAALALHATLAERFWDAERGGFFATEHDVTPGLGRPKPDDDLPLPSGNAVAADTLLRLAELTGDDTLRRRAEDTVRALAPSLARSPTRAPRLLGVVDWLVDRPREIAIVHPTTGADGRLVETVRGHFLPNRVLTVVRENDIGARATLVPLLAGKEALGGRSTAYLCTRGVCALPTTDPAVLERQLSEIVPLPSE